MRCHFRKKIECILVINPILDGTDEPTVISFTLAPKDTTESGFDARDGEVCIKISDVAICAGAALFAFAYKDCSNHGEAIVPGPRLASEHYVPSIESHCASPHLASVPHALSLSRSRSIRQRMPASAKCACWLPTPQCAAWPWMSVVAARSDCWPANEGIIPYDLKRRWCMAINQSSPHMIPSWAAFSSINAAPRTFMA